MMGAVGTIERARERSVGETVAHVGRVDGGGDFDEVVAIDLSGGLGERDAARSCPERCGRKSGKDRQNGANSTLHVISSVKADFCGASGNTVPGSASDGCHRSLRSPRRDWSETRYTFS